MLKNDSWNDPDSDRTGPLPATQVPLRSASETVGLSPGTHSTHEEVLLHDSEFGDYKLIHSAGSGGMGVVYCARRRSTGETVALKMMKLHALGSPDLVRRFQREIRIVDAIHHPNIVPILDVGAIHGQLYYAMPYVPLNLAVQKHAYRDPRAAAELVMKVARGLHHAHANGIVHRDIKPGNILLTESGEPLIADFGLARWIDNSQQLTATLDRLGTPAYMAPEQASSASQDLGPSVDIWSLGVILFELLTGERPFSAGNPDALIYQICHSEAPTPQAFRPEIDPALATIVQTCLAKDRFARYATAAALADDLERWLAGRPIRAQLPSTPLPTERMSAASRWSPRNRGLTLLFAGAGGLLLWGVGSMMSNRPPSGAGDRGQSAPAISEAKVQPALDRLRRGQPTDFLEGGWPLWSRHLIGTPATAPLSQHATSREFVFSSNGTGMLAVVPDPQRPSFRVDARLWHDQAKDGTSWIGLALGYDAATADDKTYQAFVIWHFNDLFDVKQDISILEQLLPDRGPFARMMLFENGRRQQTVQLRTDGPPSQFVPGGTTKAGPKWRDLAVEVRPDVVRFYLDQESVSVPVAELNQSLAVAIRQHQPTLTEKWKFNARSPIALAAHQSAVRVRSFTVTPLD